jgi:hypothetical protein
VLYISNSTDVGNGCFESARCASFCCLPATAAARQGTLCSDIKLYPPLTHYRIYIQQKYVHRKGLDCFQFCERQLAASPGTARKRPGGTWVMPRSAQVRPPGRALPVTPHPHSAYIVHKMLSKTFLMSWVLDEAVVEHIEVRVTEGMPSTWTKRVCSSGSSRITACAVNRARQEIKRP